MADEQETGEGPTVKDLLDQYETGEITFDQLVSGIVQVGHFEQISTGDWSERYDRAEIGPDDNSFAQVETAEFLGVLTEEQVEAIAKALEQEGED